jgi:PAS domain S-box-containing protein
MNVRLKQIAVVVGLISLMTFLYFKTNVIDSEAHNRFDNQLRHLKELDATIDKNILEARYGLSNSYDALNAEINQTNELHANIKNVPAFVDEDEKREINQLLDKYVELQNQKHLLIESFKSKNAVINNSLRYFPVATSKLVKNKKPGDSAQNQADKLNNLLRDTLVYYLLTDKELEPEITNQIEDFHEQQANKTLTNEQSELDITVNHARTIVKLKPEIDEIVRETLSIPVSTQSEELIKLYNSFYNLALSRANTYRLFLYIFSILLLAYIGFIIVKLKKATSLLNKSNETLEQRVRARTDELVWSNSELQKSEQNNRALLHAMPDSMWRTDKNGVFLDLILAKGGESILPAGEWRGKTIFEVLPKNVAAQTIQLAEKSLTSGETQIFEYQLSREEKIKHYESRVVVCGESEILTIVRDITELKQAEAESRVISEIIQGINTTSNLKELLRHVHGSISKNIYAENCFIAIYDKATEMLDMQFFVDKYDSAPSAIKLGKGLTSYVFRNGQPMLLTFETIQKLIESGEIETIGTPPAIWLGVPLKAPTGIIGVLVIQHYEDENTYNQRDLELLTSIGDQIALAIERKTAEAALRASEARFQSAFDYAPIGIGLVSPDGRWQQVNHSLCEIVGYSKEELQSLDFQSITFAEDLAESHLYREKLLDGAIKTCQFQKRYIHKEGHQILATTNLSLARDAKNNPLYIIAQIQNITEQKSLEDQLQRAQKLESIGQLAAGIAHEINTPTQYVGDNTRFLKDSFQSFISVTDKHRELLERCQTDKFLPDLASEIVELIEDSDIEYLSDEVPKAIEQVLHGVDRISKIVQSMKDFAHPGSVDKKATNLNRTIESTITVASNEWKYVAEMVTDYDLDLPAVPCLAGEFNQVVLNMIVNAAHAIGDVVGNGGEKGKIRVSTKRAGDWAEIRIGDTGTGIPEDVKKRIFDPFFTTKEVGRGSGQGLAISHTVIVEKHKGFIDIETEPGKGTTFVIRLPLNEA